MGRKRILLVEDDPSLLITMRYVLEDSGYDIVAATNHSEVRAALVQGAFDLAIVDYFLDNLPAADLIVEMRAQHPHMPLVCSTAAFAEQIHLEDPAAMPDVILYKPFGADELRRVLASLAPN